MSDDPVISIDWHGGSGRAQWIGAGRLELRAKRSGTAGIAAFVWRAHEHGQGTFTEARRTLSEAEAEATAIWPHDFVPYRFPEPGSSYTLEWLVMDIVRGEEYRSELGLTQFQVSDPLGRELGYDPS